MASRIRSVLGRIARSYVLFVVIGLVVGLVLAPVAFTATSEAEDVVAVVPLEGSIDGQSAGAVASQIDRARTNPQVKAVVIVSNSGGGTASGSETLYLASKRLADSDKPLVASIDAAAASGAYYTIAPADEILAKPSSIVGSVGVRAPIPQDIEPNNIEGTTGPDKVTGYSDREFFYVLESLRLAFVNAVVEGRGDRLQLSRDEVSQAQIYSGAQAVQVGLADGIGDRQEAIRIAAERAGLDSYSTRTYRPDGTATFVARTNFLASTAPDKEMVPVSRYAETTGGLPTFLMMPGTYVADDGDRRYVSANEVREARGGDVLDGAAPPTDADPPATPALPNASAPAGGDDDASGPAQVRAGPRVAVAGGGAVAGIGIGIGTGTGTETGAAAALGGVV